VAAPNSGAACAWFGFALGTAATLDVFSRLEVTNDGLFQTFFESAPNGSDHINVWFFCIVIQTDFPPVYGGQRCSNDSAKGQAEKLSASYISGTLEVTGQRCCRGLRPPIFEAFLIRDIRAIELKGSTTLEGKVARVSGEGVG